MNTLVLLPLPCTSLWLTWRTPVHNTPCLRYWERDRKPYSSFNGDPHYSDDSEFDSADDDEIRQEDMFEDQVEFGDR